MFDKYSAFIYIDVFIKIEKAYFIYKTWHILLRIWNSNIFYMFSIKTNKLRQARVTYPFI